MKLYYRRNIKEKGRDFLKLCREKHTPVVFHKSIKQRYENDVNYDSHFLKKYLDDNNGQWPSLEG